MKPTMRRARFPLIVGVAACSKQPAPPPPPGTPSGDRPNLVVVLVDDLRFDEFDVAGHPYLETPNIDRLAAEGALFVNAFHAVPLCSPNRATLLTGQFPSRHGIIDNMARDLASHHLETFNIPLRSDLVAVPVGTGPTFSTGVQKTLFFAQPFVRNGGDVGYDVSPDGKRFLMARPVGANRPNVDELILVENFFQELKATVKK